MFSSRCLKAIVLLVAVMAAGFVLFETYFIQEAAASCVTGYIICDMVLRAARDICNREGWGSTACANAHKEAIDTCIREYILCEN